MALDLPTLDAAPISHTLVLPADVDVPIDDLTIPASPGVVIFEAADGRTVLIATTADARGLVRKRLGLEHEDTEAKKAWRVDYRAMTARVLVIRVGSMLEADAVYLAQARERLPHAHKVVAERWRAWFAHVDPEAEFPEWTKTNLLGLVGTRSAGTLKKGSVMPGGPTGSGGPAAAGGVLLGPLPDKDAAGRFIEAVVDAFDLCRFHHLLVQAPRASPCAYKEMGRCPAPCDGAEAMEAYRRRTREAVDLLAGGALAGLLARLESQMQASAAASDYERAGEIKRRVDRLNALAKPAFAQVARLDAWSLVLITRAGKAGWVRVMVFAGGKLFSVASVRAEQAGEATGPVLEAARSIARACTPVVIGDRAVETIGLVTRWVFMPEKKRLGRSISMMPSIDESGLVAAVRAVARVKDEAAAADQILERLDTGSLG